MSPIGGHRQNCCSHDEGECGPPGGARVRGFVHSWLLLQLARGPAHGYELLERWEDDEAPDPGFLYRALRGLEEDGLVQSAWDTAGPGPARRVYAITDLGRDYLHAWSVHLRRTRDRLDRFLADYASLVEGKGGERHAQAPR
ncbi:MAG: helix-turn-helix transcriptional regulator [Candidatus Bipolaricaulota bacterium]|nr:helix-turn-helix transcriptional regulator [Candidatus Bipolaricaulota bacterium]